MELSANMQCQNTEQLKQLSVDSRESSSNNPVASYDYKSDGTKVSESITPPLSSPSLLSFLI
jgi:hypothetical protein